MLITGASSGIGEALAKEFAEAGYALVLVARNEQRLARVAADLKQHFQVPVWVQPLDLARRGAAGKLAQAMRDQDLTIDILVNNAGVLEHGRFTDLGASANKRLLDLNVYGLSDMLTHFLPPMIERRHGRILNVASIAAFQPVPMLATYAATKAYVLSLSESLSEELAGTGVAVTALCPGITDTNMFSSAQEQSAGLKQMPGFIVGEVSAVAAEGFRACIAGDAICVPGAVNQFATITGRAMPKWMLRRLAGLMARYASSKDKV